MKNQNRLTNEFYLYALIFFLALVIRLILLGNTPLMDSEASLALQAWRLGNGEVLAIGSQVLYLSLTEGLFTIFGSGVFLARLWPAVGGTLLILAVYLLREPIGRVPALLLAVGVALDPALLASSRLVGSPLPALVFLFLALAAFQARKLPWTFFLLLLGLLSGPALWLGVIGFGITILICTRWGILQPGIYIQERLDLLGKEKSTGRSGWMDFALPGLLVGGLATFFFTEVQGLSAWTGSISDFISSWGNLTLFKAPSVLINLGVSNPLILIFGCLGFIQAWREGQKLVKTASIWFVVFLTLLLVYPGRQPVDLIWLVLPLWLAAARELVRLYQLARGSWPIYSLAGLISVLMTLNWLTFTGMVFQVDTDRALLLQWGLIAASLALALLALTIAASEWGWPSAKKGLVLGAGCMLFLYTMSGAAQGAYLKAGDPRSLWTAGTGAGQMDLLLDTIAEVSITQTGTPNSIAGAVLHGNDSLRWVLRDLPKFEFISAIHPESFPPILITFEEDQFQVPEDTYRGQDFVIRSKSDWPGFIPPDWVSWLAFRKGPIQNEDIILWIRGDILPGDE